jgi:cytochrome oxidase Cu insertion factor (SCO1/SenC/PrrC family)
MPGISRSIQTLAWSVGLVAVVAACDGRPSEAKLGPKDGHDLPPTDAERVAVGDAAPDFSLRTLSGEVLTLSDLRGQENVVLVFYRGHW